jgi:hypothetical protein
MRIRRLPRAVDLPALAAFARAYLHEDVIAEHGSAVGAAAAFASDASPDERRRLVAELQQLAHAFDGKSAGRLARFFTEELRASWAPASVADLRSLIAPIDSVDAR